MSDTTRGRYCWSEDDHRFVGYFETAEEAAQEALGNVGVDDLLPSVEVKCWIGECGEPLEEPDPDEGLEYAVLRPRRLVVTSVTEDATGVRIGYRFDDGATGVAAWTVKR